MMTEARKAKRQTAANNPALARIKRAMNGPIYKGCMERMNDPAGGVEAVRSYLRRFYREDCQGRADELIDGE